MIVDAHVGTFVGENDADWQARMERFRIFKQLLHNNSRYGKINNRKAEGDEFVEKS